MGVSLGVPNDLHFQKRVLLALMKLLEAPEENGPVLIEDYPEDAPEIEDDLLMGGISCPVFFGDPNETEIQGIDRMHTEFLREIAAMRSWYDMSVEKRKRTTVGVSRIDLNDLGNFIYAFTGNEMPENPRPDIDISTTLKAAVEDLRAYYFEAVISQPGRQNVSNRALLEWYWKDTVAGKVLREVQKACVNSRNESIKLVAERFIVPMAYLEQET